MMSSRMLEDLTLLALLGCALRLPSFLPPVLVPLVAVADPMLALDSFEMLPASALCSAATLRFFSCHVRRI